MSTERDHLMLAIGAMQGAEVTPPAVAPSLRTRCTEIFTQERTARMVERVNKAEGYTHTRIDAVPSAVEGEVKFLVWASMDPLPDPVEATVLWTPPAEWGLRAGRIVLDPTLPPGTIVIEQNGKELGRIILS